MFLNCYSLIKEDFSKLILEEISNMENLFTICKSLREIYLLNFNTKNVTN